MMRSIVPSLALSIVIAACSSSATTDNGSSGTSGGSGNDSGASTTRVDSGTPDSTTSTPDGSTSGDDAGTTDSGGESTPAFDITQIGSIQGTFVTDMTDGTITWSFTIDQITDPTQPTGTARWNAQPVPANAAYAPDVDLALTLSLTSATADPSTGTWEFSGTSATPYSYVLVKVAGGKLGEFDYYRRVLDDGEPSPPPDQPHSLSYTVTPK